MILDLHYMTELVVGGTIDAAGAVSFVMLAGPLPRGVRRMRVVAIGLRIVIGRMCDPGSSVSEESDAPVYSEAMTCLPAKSADDKLLRVLKDACQKIIGLQPPRRPASFTPSENLSSRGRQEARPISM